MKILLLSLLGGGIVCWLPSIGLHFIRQSKFTGTDVMVITVLMPLIAYKLRQGIMVLTAKSWLVSIAILFGVLIVAPLAMMLGATFSGGGFNQPDVWNNIGTIYLVLPLSILTMSTYDGTLGGLALTLIVLLIQPKKNKEMYNKSLE